MPGTRRIIVTELKHIQDGRTKGGDAYTLWQVRATKEDGTPIQENLRTFDKLETDIPLDVTIEKFESDRFGVSYTVKPAQANPARPSSAAQSHDMSELISRLEALEGQVAALNSLMETTVMGKRETDDDPAKPKPNWSEDDDPPF